MNNFYQRLALGSIGTIFAILCIWFSPHPIFRHFFALIIATLITVAAYELYDIAKSKKYEPLVKIGLAGCFFYALSIYICIQFPSMEILPYLILLLTLFSSFFYFFKSGTDPLANLSITMFALVYIAIPLSTWFNIAYFFPNNPNLGRWWLFYLLAVTKITDMGAYFVGSTLGKHKMTPYISPGKSWEGAVGGLIFGIGVSFLFYKLLPQLSINMAQSLGLGLILSFMGQIGDLSESLIKRDAGIKNSSQIPGLGGILDILDSLVFTSPILYIFLKTQAGF